MLRLSFATLLALVFVTVPVGAQDILLTNGRIIDPTTETVQRGNLLILSGRIAGHPDEPPSTFAGDIVDLGDRWVVPGLHDLHTHSFGNVAPGNALDTPGPRVIAQRLLYAGVTGFLDLFSPEDAILSLRDRLRNDPQVSADVYAAGPCFTATDGHCSEYGFPTRLTGARLRARSAI